jgi:hypothetical protein
MTDLESLVREVLLPRIIRLEIELDTLRKHTWPYVQAQREHNQLDDIETKREFIKNLDDDTVKELLNLKAKCSKTSGLQKSEYDALEKPLLLKKIICSVHLHIERPGFTRNRNWLISIEFLTSDIIDTITTIVIHGNGV